MPINQQKENRFFFCIGLGAILFYSHVIYTHAINMPKWDDFPDILQFMDRWLQAGSLHEKYSLFLYHTNEHILLVNHVITLAQYYLMGHIDFRWLIFTGNLFYLGSVVVLWLPFRHKDISAFAFAILMLAALNFYSHESTLWAMTAISNQAVIFFSLLTIWYATQPSPSMYRVMPLTLLAIFSQSNGFLLLPVIGILFFISHKEKLFPWLVFSVLAITGYILMLAPASHQGNLITSAAIPYSHWWMSIPGFIALFGSTLFDEVNIPAFLAAFLLGILILFWVLKQVRTRQYPAFSLYVLLFLGLSVASIAFYRGLLAGPSVVFVSRYKMYAIYFLVTGLLLGPTWIAWYQSSPLRRYCLLLFCLLFFFASFYLNLPKAIQINGDLRESLENWIEDGDFRRGKGYFIKDSDSYIFAAMHRDIWSPLSLVADERILEDITLLDICPDSTKIPANNPASPILLKHINRNAPGIKLDIVSPSLAITTPWTIYLCSTTARYRIDFIPRQDTRGIYPVYYIPAKMIAPEKYVIYVEFNDTLLATGQTLWRKPHTR